MKNSQSILLSIVLIPIAFAILFASLETGLEHISTMATIDNLESEKYLDETKEEIIIRYIAMGHYTNSLIDSTTRTMFTILKWLLLATSLLVVLSLSFSVYIWRSSSKRLKAQGDTNSVT